MKAKYIYGIVSGEEVRFSSRGFFNKKPYLVTCNGIAAIVTDAPLRTYEQDEEGILTHNRVLEDVIKVHTVLPMRFATVASSEEEVRALLRSASSTIRNSLSKIKDAVEFSLEISICNEQTILKEILENNTEVRELRDKLLAQGDSAGLQDKLTIGKMISEQVAKHNASLLKAIDTSLKPYYSNCKSFTQKDKLANLSFLVPRRQVKKFESTIYELGEIYKDTLKFKYAGPLAPYSFVEMTMILINFEKIERARRELRLGEKATFKEIKTSYRGLARQYHPDKSPGDSSSEEEFKRIAESYRLLYEYCRHYPRKLYVFKPEEINEFSVVTVRT